MECRQADKLFFMPLAESEAIILRARPVGEADKVVSVFTRAAGRLRGLAPAARRSRQRFGAALEPLSYVRLWFYERAERDQVRLAQCELIESFWDLGGDYGRTLAAGHVTELLELLLPEREVNERAFRLALMTLRGVKEGKPVWLALTYFQLWMAQLSGWLPALDRCQRCQRALENAPAYASPSRGEWLCGRCRKGGLRVLKSESLADAAALLTHPLDRLPADGWTAKRCADLRQYLLDVIEHHGGQKLATRESLNEIRS